jgi:hypothetical protein
MPVLSLDDLTADIQDHRGPWLRWMAQEREFFAADQTRDRADLRADLRADGSSGSGLASETHVLTG